MSFHDANPIPLSPMRFKRCGECGCPAHGGAMNSGHATNCSQYFHDEADQAAVLNVPELVDLLDERDRLREEPDSESNRAALSVVAFLLKVRRGHCDIVPTSAWQANVLHAHLGGTL